MLRAIFTIFGSKESCSNLEKLLRFINVLLEQGFWCDYYEPYLTYEKKLEEEKQVVNELNYYKEQFLATLAYIENSERKDIPNDFEPKRTRPTVLKVEEAALFLIGLKKARIIPYKYGADLARLGEILFDFSHSNLNNLISAYNQPNGYDEEIGKRLGNKLQPILESL